ncbi:hypothetical protein AMK59_497 [Oryctes borbonicus]|uniref:ADP-ribosylation factor-like protein 6-interacting protein 4 n=1 Tax=Oryctes borbonicus TaxID=1629725 RepID=A0A0T6BH86_9SCAR|nr:hypothetical protein AMK59_497 [Oryctes borbonicus]
MKHKHSDKSKKSKKRKHESNESSSLDSDDVKRKKKKRDHKKSSDSDDQHHKKKKSKHFKNNRKEESKETQMEPNTCFDVPISLMNPDKAMAPMTKEEWEKRQSFVRKVFDETSGRYRMIKGDGEVIEEIVSRERHKEINRQATKGDGDYFQTQLSSNLKK